MRAVKSGEYTSLIIRAKIVGKLFLKADNVILLISV